MSFSFEPLVHSVKSTWIEWSMALLVLLLIWLAGFAFRRVVFFALARWSAKTSTQIDDILIKASSIHVPIWFFLLGIYAACGIAPLSHATRVFMVKMISSGFLLSITFLGAGIASGAMEAYGKRIAMSLPLTSLTENLIRLAIIVIGILVLLSHLGISIAPLLTALGVSSLAVALALQDTLSNLFAGFYIIANKQIRTGDYIKVETGQEGYVLDIGWRSTRLRQLSNNIILVPNARLGTAIVVNYALPASDLSIVIPVSVAYDSDLGKVEKVTVEVARETLTAVAGGVPDFEPTVRFTAFGDSAIQFNTGLKVKSFVDQYLVTHEFIKRLHSRYAREKIEMPFPQRTVHLVPTKAG